MSSSYTSRLKLERQASGENSGNWGNLVNFVFNPKRNMCQWGYLGCS
mgnify:CR=1 FL=1